MATATLPARDSYRSHFLDIETEVTQFTKSGSTDNLGHAAHAVLSSKVQALVATEGECVPALKTLWVHQE